MKIYDAELPIEPLELSGPLFDKSLDEGLDERMMILFGLRWPKGEPVQLELPFENGLETVTHRPGR
jgi:hypothetical protein